MHPRKLLALLRHVEVGMLERFCDACTAPILRAALPELLRLVEHKPLVEVLAPLLNNSALHESLFKLMRRVDIPRIARIVNEVGPGKLDIALRCEGDLLATLLRTVHDSRISMMLLPLIHKPHCLLTLLQSSSDFKKLAAVVNYVEPEVILWILGRVTAWRLAAIVDSFTEHQLEPEGCFTVLMQNLQGQKQFVQEEVAPFLQMIPPRVVAQLVQGVPSHKFLKVLRHIGAAEVVRILENTNVDLIIRLWNGPLRCTVALGAQPLSFLQRNVALAAGIRQITDHVESGLAALDVRSSDFGIPQKPNAHITASSGKCLRTSKRDCMRRTTRSQMNAVLMTL
jgi:hypothetical protein